MRICKCTCNMNDRDMDKTVCVSWLSHNNDQVVHAPIIHVAGAVTDTDETHGADVAAENDTLNNIDNSNSSSNSNFTFQKYAKILRTSLRAARSAKIVDLGL